MAGLILGVQSDEFTAKSTTNTVLQVGAPTTRRIQVLGWGIYFKGTSATNAPVKVELAEQDGSMTGTALTSAQIRDGVYTPFYSSTETEAIAVKHSGTADPSENNIAKTVEVHPQSGYEEAMPFGQEFIVKPGRFVGIRATAPNNVKCVAWMRLNV